LYSGGEKTVDDVVNVVEVVEDVDEVEEVDEDVVLVEHAGGTAWTPGPLPFANAGPAAAKTLAPAISTTAAAASRDLIIRGPPWGAQVPAAPGRGLTGPNARGRRPCYIRPGICLAVILSCISCFS